MSDTVVEALAAMIGSESDGEGGSDEGGDGDGEEEEVVEVVAPPVPVYRCLHNVDDARQCEACCRAVPLYECMGCHKVGASQDIMNHRPIDHPKQIYMLNTVCRQEREKRGGVLTAMSPLLIFQVIYSCASVFFIDICWYNVSDQMWCNTL